MQYRAGLNAAGRGLGDLVESLMGGDALAAKARRSHEKDLANAYYDTQRGRKAGFEADIAQDTHGARMRLGDHLAEIVPTLGLNPQAAPALSGMYRASGGNAGQLGDLVRHIQAGNYVNQAGQSYAGGNRDLANFQLRQGGETPYTPYAQNAQGSVLNEATGTVDQTNPIAQANLGELAAQIAEHEASAAKGAYRHGKYGVLDTRSGEVGPLPEGIRGASDEADYEYKPADANTLFRAAGAMFGGIYDPITGTFTGLDDATAQKVAMLAQLAEQALRTSGGSIGHHEAIAQAAARMGISLPRLPGQAPAAPLGNDPLGIRP